MTGLVLKLAPYERLLVNGVIIENGDRRTKLSILTPSVNLLRLRDALHPEDTDTPVKRVCYIAQLALTGDADPDEAKHQINHGVDGLSYVFRDEESHSILQSAKHALATDQFYQVLRALRKLLPKENEIMNRYQT